MLVGKERFSENHAWSEMPQHWPSRVAGRAVIEVVGQGRLEARLVDGGPPVDVVVPMWSPLPGWAIRAGGFGLVQQFGVGVDNVDLDAAVGDDAVTLENELHKMFADRRVNFVNERREFFFATPAEVRAALLEKDGGLLEFHESPDAPEYFQSVGHWPDDLDPGSVA